MVIREYVKQRGVLNIGEFSWMTLACECVQFNDFRPGISMTPGHVHEGVAPVL